MSDNQEVQERIDVARLGNRIGYGRLMSLASEMWRETLSEQGMQGSEFTVGPCEIFMVKCGHLVKDRNGHCDLCCGAGLISKGIAALVLRLIETN